MQKSLAAAWKKCPVRLFLALLFFALPAAAAETAELIPSQAKIEKFPGGGWKRSADTNGDGKADLVFVYDSRGKLTREEIDQNVDGKIDVTVDYHRKGYRKQISTLRDGRFNRVEDAVKRGDSYLVNVTEAGRAPTSYRQPVKQPLEEMKAYTDCLMQPKGSEAIARLLELEKVFQAKATHFSPIGNGMFRTDYGLLVDDKCIEIYGADRLHRLLRESILQTASCMLAHAKGPMPRQTVERLAALLANEKNPLKIQCSRAECWDDAVALGSVGDSSENYIALSPYESSFITDDTQLKSTLVHEMMHNCGHSHGDTVDVSYGCESCCVDMGNTPTSRAAACRICGGSHSDISSRAYQQDFLAWAKGYNWTTAPSVAINGIISDMLRNSKRSAEDFHFLFSSLADIPEMRNLAVAIAKNGKIPLIPGDPLVEVLRKEKVPPAAVHMAESLRLLIQQQDAWSAFRVLEKVPVPKAADKKDPLLDSIAEHIADDFWKRMEENVAYGSDAKIWESRYKQTQKRFGVYKEADSKSCKLRWPPSTPDRTSPITTRRSGMAK